jgi:hypothetical protein
MVHHRAIITFTITTAAYVNGPMTTTGYTDRPAMAGLVHHRFLILALLRLCLF